MLNIWNKKYFKYIGEHYYLQPWNFGTEAHLISFGDNVHIATNVHFVNHDIINFMFDYMSSEYIYFSRQEEIRIRNNVFIGGYSKILYDVTIGNNVIIGAGSLVNKDVLDGVIAAGVPCRVIGKFDEYMIRLRKWIGRLNVKESEMK